MRVLIDQAVDGIFVANTDGRYVDVNIRRDDAARFGMNIADVQSVITAAVGGDNIGETVEGLQRFPISVRYPREIRDSLEKIRKLPIVSERGARLVLSAVVAIAATVAALAIYDGIARRRAARSLLVEIAAEVADSDRSVIVEQVGNGVSVRMAVLYLLLGGQKEGSP